MRHFSLRRGRAVVALLATLALTLPAAAHAGGGPDSKIDRRLIALMKKQPQRQLRVLVLGEELDDERSRVGGKPRRELEVVDAQSMRVRLAVLRRLARDPDVEYISLDSPVVPTAASTPLSFPLLANSYPASIGATSAWASGYTGQGVGIAVIDSGVRPLGDFGTRLVRVQLDGQTAVEDVYGHGSFVAGVAAGESLDGRFVGVAPRASVIAINVRALDGGVYSSDIIAGLDWVLANHAQYGIRVVNLSLAEVVPSSYLSNALDTAVERLWRSGIVVVASSGNAGPGNPPNAPGNDPFVITVGSTDPNATASTADDTISSFSSGGTTADGFAKPELLAPGRRVASILSTGTVLASQAPLTNLIAPGYATMSGTSFSAPQVAGAAAVILQRHPNLTPDQVKWLLTQTAGSLSGSSLRTLDLSAAVAFTGTPGSANQGLVPTTYGLVGGDTADPTSSTWNSSTWNSSTWNSSTWNSSTWNSHVWD